jgi:hypothetical protein
MRLQFKRNDVREWRAERIVGISGGIFGKTSNLLTGSFILEEKEILLDYAKKFFPKFKLVIRSIIIQPGAFTEEELYFKFANEEDEAHFILLCSGGIEI